MPIGQRWMGIPRWGGSTFELDGAQNSWVHLERGTERSLGRARGPASRTQKGEELSYGAHICYIQRQRCANLLRSTFECFHKESWLGDAFYAQWKNFLL